MFSVADASREEIVTAITGAEFEAATPNDRAEPQ
jgi:hypothetical protein